MRPPQFVQMPMWIGSLQNERSRVHSEDPLAEAWSQIALLATKEFGDGVRPRDSSIPWSEHLEYGQVRIRQALEFRAAAHSSSLLTAPLPLYYSFLCLLRAYMALVLEKMPVLGHGLKFIEHDGILDCEARLVSGTFADYLETIGKPNAKGNSISLREALGCVVELHGEAIKIGLPSRHVQSVWVEGLMSGEITLRFLGYPRTLSDSWKEDFPNLERIGERVIGDALSVQGTYTSYEAAGQFAYAHLLDNLTVLDSPRWWALRVSELGSLRLDRMGYYYVAAFILGSAVRYKPELVLSISGTDSGIGWFLRRFLAGAERFFPQMLLSAIYRDHVYF